MSKPKLALIPSGYKSGKVYSILPNDATGDFDFTRQSIGTRVRKDGLIEEAKTVGSITNLQIRSEEFDNSVWSKSNSTVTANDTLAPDGTNSADKIVGNTSTGNHYVQNVISGLNTSSQNTISIFVKKDEITQIEILGAQSSSPYTNWARLRFNLDTLTTLQAPIGEYGYEELSNGWIRLSITGTPTSSSAIIRFTLYKSNSSNWTGNNIDGFYLWGAMVSEGALSDYIKTEGTTETKTVETFTDVPRLDWLNSNCPSLLLEPQRSNFFTYSEDASQWTTSRGTTTSNNIVAPNGELLGSLYEKTQDANEGYIYRNLTVSSVGTYSVSLFFKYNNSQYAHFLLFDGSSNGARVWFDIENGVVGTTTTFGSTFTASDLSIENYGNGWYRCSAKYVVTGTDTTWRLRVSPSGGNGVTISDSGAKVYFFGAQIEQGSYPTSYIKTETGTVTRLKDDLQDLNNVDLINSVEGVFYAEIRAFKSETVFRFITLNDDTSSNTVRIYLYNRIYARLLVGGVEQCIFNTTDYDVTEFNKIAFLYSPNNFKLFVNGVLIGTDTSGSTFANETLTTLSFDRGDNAFRFDGAVKDLRVYNTTLTDNELIELTK